MSSLSSHTLFSEHHLALHFHSRRLLLQIPIHQSKPEASPPVTSHDPLDPSSGQSSFNANAIIILSLLVCGVICSIGMNFIVRCALRCMNSPSAENPSAQIPSKGIKKKVLKTFTTVKYAEGLKLPVLDTECVICLSEFRAGEIVRILPKCNHGYHKNCIDKWLNLHSSCPSCRNCLIETSPKSLSAPTPEAREIVLSITPSEPEGFVCN